ncbi:MULTISPECIES: hypothetical protein [Shewanella]|uniref:Uncharacterized protein n=1 Tax=Shewanella fodinae TaxID=552357 RepID=A0A4R2FH18_9GAMM|nr:MULTISPECIES: hypothetical protein [Shewanella]MDN5369836.1 hypothetical protein [Shewanella sp.]MBO1270054.1 hypothetical protein [Shewanella sp. 4t3-1-2LB]MCL2905109.1 hypothetical protein [Shewanella fodinae]TCN90155.1 hypothetical protein EDC91_10267 [Shewanella fodinae]GGY88535.1 hypothetical protein GCM10007169_02170 [Shewanella fodinae]
MSYKVDGHEITVNFPVDSISINKNSIAFTDRKGKKKQTFSKRSDVISFMKWLVSANK